MAIAVAASMLAADHARGDAFGAGENQFTIDFSTIGGNAGGANGTDIGFGRVFQDPGVDFRIGVYEITNDQMDKFIASLGVPLTGKPSGAYGTDPAHAGDDVPTNNASWLEAAQFVNWLNTSTGNQPAYKFEGAQGESTYEWTTWLEEEAAPGTNEFRHKDALYFLPTESEWIKAAYWNGSELQHYANQASADLVGVAPDPAKWNYDSASAPWDVGSGAEELNRTYDMMGNIWELTETAWDWENQSENQMLRGGGFDGEEGLLSLTGPGSWSRFSQRADVGFRVASAIPGQSPKDPADFNDDGSVDGADLAIWENNFPIGDGSASNAQGDADFNSDVNGRDYLIWQRRHAPPVGGALAVPEPTSAILIALAGAGVLATLRRARMS